MERHGRGRTSSLSIEELAKTIASLEPDEQDDLLKLVAEFNFAKGLKDLSQRVRQRLMAEGNIDQKANEVLASLRESRDQIAANDYRH